MGIHELLTSMRGTLTVVVLSEDVTGDEFRGHVVGVSNDSGGNLASKADVLELGVHLRGLDGDVSGTEVGGEADLEVDLLGLVVGGKKVLGMVLPSEVAGEAVDLVGGVLDGLGDASVLDLEAVLVHVSGGEGGVLAGGEEVVSVTGLLFAEGRDGLLADVLFALGGAFHVGLDVNLGLALVELLAEGDLGVNVSGGLVLDGLLVVGKRSVRDLDDGEHGDGVLATVGAGLAHVDEGGVAFLHGAGGTGDGGNEDGLAFTLELGGQVDSGGAADCKEKQKRSMKLLSGEVQVRSLMGMGYSLFMVSATR